MATTATAVNDIRNSIATTTNGIKASVDNITSTTNNIVRSVSSIQSNINSAANALQSSNNNTANLAQTNINGAINMVNGVKNRIGDTSFFSSRPYKLDISNGVDSIDQDMLMSYAHNQYPTYDLIGKPTNLTPLFQLSGEFSVMADPVSMACASMGDMADSFLKPNYSLLGDLPGLDLPKNPFADLISKGKDGLAKINDLANAPKAAIEGAKSSLLKGSESLRASFNTLPNFMQKAIFNESGIFDKGLMSAKSITTNVGNFYEKAISGDYVLNPKSLTRDINALTSFTSAAIKGGVANSLVSLVGGLGNKFGPIGSIITKVGAGMLVSKNSRGLAKLGISLNGNRNILPISALKPAIVKTVFSGLKKEFKTKANDKGTLRTQALQTASVFDKTTNKDNPVPSIASMGKPSYDLKESFSFAIKDRSIAPVDLTREKLASDAASRARMMDLLNATDAGMEAAMDSSIVLSPGRKLTAAELKYLSDNTTIL